MIIKIILILVISLSENWLVPVWNSAVGPAEQLPASGSRATWKNFHEGKVDEGVISSQPFCADVSNDLIFFKDEIKRLFPHEGILNKRRKGGAGYVGWAAKTSTTCFINSP